LAGKDFDGGSQAADLLPDAVAVEKRGIRMMPGKP